MVTFTSKTAPRPDRLELELPARASSTKVSLRGHEVARIAATVERRVVIPMNDDVVDLEERRLRATVNATTT